jgi:hypothetical protein
MHWKGHDRQVTVPCLLIDVQIQSSEMAGAVNDDEAFWVLRLQNVEHANHPRVIGEVPPPGERYSSEHCFCLRYRALKKL